MTQRKPTLCVVAGPNGSGKTTTTVQLLNDEWTADSLYINPDNIAQETFGDLPRLLYRTVDGKLFKQYTDDIPEWARLLMREG